MRSFILTVYKQGRREPRVGPGTAKILRISGFVQSKRSKENGTIFSEFSSDLKKNDLRSSISMGPMKPIGPSDGPLQAHGPLKPHGPPDGPLKSMGSGDCAPPSRRPCIQATSNKPNNFLDLT